MARRRSAGATERARRLFLLGLAILAATPALAQAPPATPAGVPTAGAFAIDLPTALRLAGAQSLDIAIAEQKLAEARAAARVARDTFLPSLQIGAGYRRHEGRVQETKGDLLAVDKQSYATGGALTTDVDLGEALFRTLEARQLEQAAQHALAGRRADVVLAAAQAYLDLARARAAVAVAEEALRVARDFEDQLHRAVAAGIALRGDELRAQVRRHRDEIELRRSRAEQRVRSARLAEILRLDIRGELEPAAADPVAFELIAPDAPIESLLAEARAARPELEQAEAKAAAARDAHRGAVFGPLLPSLGASAGGGGLGGGPGDATGDFGSTVDYSVGIGWRIGPGGLFDFARMREREARLRIAELRLAKRRDAVTREVVEAHARLRASADQLTVAREAVEGAEAAMEIARRRKEFAVGVVLEHLLTQQDLADARRQYVEIVAEYDKAQYALRHATGGLDAETRPATP